MADNPAKYGPVFTELIPDVGSLNRWNFDDTVTHDT